MSKNSEIRFAEMLSVLVSNSRFRNARGALAEEVGVSPSAVSQYLSGTALPRIDVLSRLAMALNVSTDYLLFGSERHLPLSREQAFLQLRVDEFLAGHSAQQNRREWLRLELGRRLDARIEAAISDEFDAALHDAALGPGMLRDEEVREIEALSSRILVVSTTLKYNVVRNVESGFKAGPFADTVIDGISRGSAYDYIVPSNLEMNIAAEAMIEIFNSLFGGNVSEKINVYFTTLPLIGGFLVYNFDWGELSDRNRFLASKVRDFMVNGQLGLMASTSDLVAGDMIMDEMHLERALIFSKNVIIPS